MLADTPEAFAAAVVRVLADEEFAFHLGRRSAKLVREQFGWPKVAEKFAEICRRAISEGQTIPVESPVLAKSNEPEIV